MIIDERLLICVCYTILCFGTWMLLCGISFIIDRCRSYYRYDSADFIDEDEANEDANIK